MKSKKKTEKKKQKEKTIREGVSQENFLYKKAKVGLNLFSLTGKG